MQDYRVFKERFCMRARLLTFTLAICAAEFILGGKPACAQTGIVQSIDLNNLVSIADGSTVTVAPDATTLPTISLSLTPTTPPRIGPWTCPASFADPLFNASEEWRATKKQLIEILLQIEFD